VWVTFLNLLQTRIKFKITFFSEKETENDWCVLSHFEDVMELTRPPLWSSGQSSWLQIRRSGFDLRRYQIFWVVMGLERRPLNLMNTTEELLDRKSSFSCLENREYGRRDPSLWPRGTLYPQKLVITSPTSDGRSVVIVRSRTQTTEEWGWGLCVVIIITRSLLLPGGC
jgi:hypothetical protein